MIATRPGRSADADPLTELYLRSRSTAMPWLTSPHDEAATRWWMEHVVLDGPTVHVAHDDRRVVGFCVIDGDWLEQLYVDPAAQGRGAGRVLLDRAKDDHPDGLRLRVFTRNAPARRFYECAGFTLVEQGDGSTNEERERDCTYAWHGRVR